MVIWTEQALNDLDIIYKFLAVSSTKVSEKIIRNILDRSLHEWIGKNEQTDDVLILGIKT